MNIFYNIFKFFIISISLFSVWGLHAEDDVFLRENMNKLMSDESDVRTEALNTLARTGDLRLEKFFESYREGSIYLWEDRLVLCTVDDITEDEDFNEIGTLSDVLTRERLLVDGKEVKILLDDLEEISPGRAERKLVRSMSFLLLLSSPDVEKRLSAVKRCGDNQQVDALEDLERIAEEDVEKRVRHAAAESVALIKLGGSDLDARIQAAVQLGELDSIRAVPRLEEFREELGKMESGKVSKAELKSVDNAIVWIGRHQSFVNGFGYLFQGLSLGSVLILMALGLSITFGLMGVINMAHGELMMVGAYATYSVQQLFVNHFPEAMFNWYYVVAFPVAFFLAGLAGYLIEILVVRHLYRRPLESLLATWGVSIIMIQSARLIFGNNIGVNSPTWLRGGAEIMQDIVVPFNRCFIILLCVFCVALIYYIMKKTRLGLLIRATMQNREMAKSLGVNTDRVDRYTFAFGSGIAGTAGYALTLIGGVTPDMGQNYIVDSFLVVVTGGVGEFAGVICSGLGIGTLTKIFEPLSIGSITVGAVWGKVIILVMVVAFIQFKPAGLFPPRGRLADV